MKRQRPSRVTGGYQFRKTARASPTPHTKTDIARAASITHKTVMMASLGQKPRGCGTCQLRAQSLRSGERFSTRRVAKANQLRRTSMKAIIVGIFTIALMSGAASARDKHHAKIKHHRHHVTSDGYYAPGIPKRDPGRYSNLPGKDAQQSKAYIQDH